MLGMERDVGILGEMVWERGKLMCGSGDGNG